MWGGGGGAGHAEEPSPPPPPGNATPWPAHDTFTESHPSTATPRVRRSAVGVGRRWAVPVPLWHTRVAPAGVRPALSGGGGGGAHSLLSSPPGQSSNARTCLALAASTGSCSPDLLCRPLMGPSATLYNGPDALDQPQTA